jgi:predicted O-methyltransferase YrrM
MPVISVPKPTHIEEQDPKFLKRQQELLNNWLLWAGASIIAWLIFREIGLLFSLITLGGLILHTILKVYHKLQVEQVQHYWQVEALFSMYASLKINHPLPPMRLWAASPDFLILAISLIKRHKPAIIFEIGSGVSTILNGYALRETGGQSVISLEHEKQFTAITADNLTAHGLDDVAHVIYAPLKPVMIDGQERLWYDTEQLANIPPIDLLIVDGPPEKTTEMARYPALPMLYDKLNNGAYILVDDFMRDDEHTMVNLWLEQFDLEVVRSYANEKGAVILRKKMGTTETQRTQS